MILPLLKITLYKSFALFRTGRKIKPIKSILPLLAMSILPVFIILRAREMFEAWLLVPQLGASFMLSFLSSALLGLFVVLILSGFPHAFYYLYLAPDLSLLAALPLAPRTIFLQKFIEMSLMGCGAFIAVGLPLMISMIWVLGGIIRAYFLLLLLFPLYVIIAGAISALLSMALAAFLNVRRIRRFFVYLTGLIIILVWAGLQFLRLSRLNPLSDDFDADMVSRFSSFFANMKFSAFPSDWLLQSIYSTAIREPERMIIPFLCLAITAAVLTRLVVLIRARSRDFSNPEIGRVFPAHPHRHSKGKLFASLFQKEMTLIFRDARVLQSYWIITAMILVWPFIQQRQAMSSIESGIDLLPFLGSLLLISLFAGNMARQTVPNEREAFQYLLSAPISIRRVLMAKLLAQSALFAGMSTVNVWLTAYRFHLFIADALVLWLCMVFCVVIGLVVGQTIGVLFGNYHWQDPRQMLTPGWNYLSPLVSILFCGLGLAIFAALWQVNQIVAFLIFFAYVGGVFQFGIMVSAKKLTKLEWI
ncbi:MAG: hypothetical protein EHM72_11875 [Calditrichaeota bacterium]|nr:MAG: hypothetical protein EHM72_11875 [Calditrichota bacterium]